MQSFQLFLVNGENQLEVIINDLRQRAQYRLFSILQYSG